jgi:hypothetical protein
VKLSEAVVARVREEYGRDVRGEVKDLLASYGEEPDERYAERVHLRILRLARGDRRRIEELVARAKRDHRDLLSRSEDAEAEPEGEREGGSDRRSASETEPND